MENKELLNKIKVYRAMKNISQEELAIAIGVTRKTINTVETGKFIPSTVLALRIARYFGVPEEEIFVLNDEASYRNDELCLTAFFYLQYQPDRYDMPYASSQTEQMERSVHIWLAQRIEHCPDDIRSSPAYQPPKSRTGSHLC